MALRWNAEGTRHSAIGRTLVEYPQSVFTGSASFEGRMGRGAVPGLHRPPACGNRLVRNTFALQCA